jgi:hypothetical protein
MSERKRKLYSTSSRKESKRLSAPITYKYVLDFRIANSNEIFSTRTELIGRFQIPHTERRIESASEEASWSGLFLFRTVVISVPAGRMHHAPDHGFRSATLTATWSPKQGGTPKGFFRFDEDSNFTGSLMMDDMIMPTN